MPDVMDLEIASVIFRVRSSEHVVIHETGPAYMSFLRKEKTGCPLEVILDLEVREMPDTGGQTVTFDGQSWTMHSDGSEYFFSSKSPAFEHPFWTAKVGRDFKKGTICCSKEAIVEKDGAVTVHNPLHYPLDQLLMMYILAQNSGSIIHAAGMEINGLGYIFPGRSGAGKSTLSRQFRGRRDAAVLSDDRIVVRQIDNGYVAYGTPWPGDEGIAVNRGVPLAGIFFMSHGKSNSIKEMSPQKAAERLLPVISIPWYDQVLTSKVLSFCDELVTTIPAYELHFKPGIETADFLVESISLNRVST
jgi:hypothetical protein